MGYAGLATAHGGGLLAANQLIILWTTLPVVGAILLGALIIAYARRWRDRPSAFTANASDQLAHFRLLYERGQLSAEEFGRLQAVLNDRLRKELNVPAAEAAGSPSTIPTAPSPPSAEGRALPLPNLPQSGDSGPTPGETNGHPRSQPGTDNPP